MASTTTSPKIKITYFDAKGRAEIARLCLAQGGIEFDDVRVKKEQWGELKPTLPHQCVPALEVGGKTICQSDAINRYCARVAGLYPEDAFEAAQVDSSMGGFVDLAGALTKVMFAKDEETKKAAYTAAVGDAIPKWLAIFEAQISAAGAGYLVGSALSLADIGLYVVGGAVDAHFGGVDAEKYPLVSALLKTVGSLPNIEAWEKAHAA